MIHPLNGSHLHIRINAVVWQFYKYRNYISYTCIIPGCNAFVFHGLNSFSHEAVVFLSVQAVVNSSDWLTVFIGHSIDVTVKGALCHDKFTISVGFFHLCLYLFVPSIPGCELFRCHGDYVCGRYSGIFQDTCRLCCSVSVENGNFNRFYNCLCSQFNKLFLEDVQRGDVFKQWLSNFALYPKVWESYLFISFDFLRITWCCFIDPLCFRL